ncbi:MAG: radical SAM protein [Thermoplasmataceae archaeon]
MLRFNENITEMPLKHSKYVYKLRQEYNGKKYTILYERLLMNIMFLDEESIKIYDEFKVPLTMKDVAKEVGGDEVESLIKTLTNQYFLVPVYDNEQWKVDEIVSNSHVPKVGVSYLVVTRICNLRCKYCFLSYSKENRTTMSIATAKNSIDQIMEATIESGVMNQKIILYGGEPFAAQRTVLFTVEYIRQKEKELKERKRLSRDVKVKIAIISNGTLIDEYIARFCKVNNVTMSISIDGSKELHDRNRVYVNGRGTYDDALRGLKLLQQEGIEVTASTTVTKSNVDSLEEVTEHLVSLGFNKIGYNILMAENIADPEIKQLSEKTATALLGVYEKYRNRNILIHPVVKQIKSLYYKNFQWSDCAACSAQLTISPEGKMGVCQAFVNDTDQFRYSVTENSNLFSIVEESPLFKEWRKRSPINMDKCMECEAIAICGGGCPYNAYYSTGSIWNIDYMFCSYAKSIVKWGLRDIFQRVMQREGANSIA